MPKDYTEKTTYLPTYFHGEHVLITKTKYNYTDPNIGSFTVFGVKLCQTNLRYGMNKRVGPWNIYGGQFDGAHLFASACLAEARDLHPRFFGVKNPDTTYLREYYKMGACVGENYLTNEKRPALKTRR